VAAIAISMASATRSAGALAVLALSLLAIGVAAEPPPHRNRPLHRRRQKRGSTRQRWRRQETARPWSARSEHSSMRSRSGPATSLSRAGKRKFPCAPWWRACRTRMANTFCHACRKSPPAAGAPLAPPNCQRANFYVIVTSDPDGVIKAWSKRDVRMFGDEADQGGTKIREFNASNPVRVWYNTEFYKLDGTPLGNTEGRTSQMARATRIETNNYRALSSIIAIIDTRRLKDVSFGQGRPTSHMIGLAQIRPQANVADAPTILNLFSASGRAPPGLTAWTNPFSKRYTKRAAPTRGKSRRSKPPWCKTSRLEPAGVALVTGASRGIGRVIAMQLAQRGARVAVHYRNNRDAAEQCLEGLAGSGHAISFAADLSDPKAALLLWQRVVEQLGAVDCPGEQCRPVRREFAPENRLPRLDIRVATDALHQPFRGGESFAAGGAEHGGTSRTSRRSIRPRPDGSISPRAAPFAASPTRPPMPPARPDSMPYPSPWRKHSRRVRSTSIALRRAGSRRNGHQPS